MQLPFKTGRGGGHVNEEITGEIVLRDCQIKIMQFKFLNLPGYRSLMRRCNVFVN